MESLGTVLDKVTGLVGRAFVVSAFVPVLLFGAANVTVFAGLEGISSARERWQKLEGLQTPTAVGFLIVAFAAGYLLMIVSPVFKRFLEGAYPLGWVGSWLRTSKRTLFVEKRQRVQSALDKYMTVRARRGEWLHALQEAAKKARSQKADSPRDVSSVQKIEGTLGELQREFWQTGSVPDGMDAAVRQVGQLYDGNFPAEHVKRLHDAIVHLAHDMEREAESAYAQTLSDLQSRFAFSSGVAGVKPTTLGNIMAASWAYPYTRYGIDATLMWPRLQKVISPSYYKVVEDARISYDFAVGMTFLSLVFTALWFGVLIRGMHWSWMWVPAAGAFACLLFNWAAIEAASAFGAVFRTCFDLFRFNLMQELRLELPSDLEAERATWNTVNQILNYEDILQELKYAHLRTGEP